MYKSLLINKINPQDFTKGKKRMFFLIGDMNILATEDKLVKLLNKSGLLDVSSDILFKYNGIELSIDVQTIPEIVKLLAKENFSIYSIYEVYSPEA